MGFENIGNQSITWRYKTPIQGEILANMISQAIRPGIYSGMETTVYDETDVTLNPGNLIIDDTNDPERITVKALFQVAARVPVTGKKYLVARFIWENINENYVDLIDVDIPAATDVIITQLLYNTTGYLTGTDDTARRVVDPDYLASIRNNFEVVPGTGLQSIVKASQAIVYGGLQDYDEVVLTHLSNTAPDPRNDYIVFSGSSMVLSIAAEADLIDTNLHPLFRVIVLNSATQLYPVNYTDLRHAKDFRQLASGGGGGAADGSLGINFPNGQFEASILGWKLYKDAAQPEPINGDGGTPSYLTLDRVTGASVLIGTGSALLSKSAGNAQGEGISYDFTVDEGNKSQVVRLSFDYRTTEAFATGDLAVFLYDVDNSSFVTVPDNLIALETWHGKFSTILALSDARTFRLIFHVASTSTSSFGVHLDNVQWTVDKATTGVSVIGDVPLTISSSSFGSTGNSPSLGTFTSKAFWSRVANKMKLTVEVNQTAGGTLGSGLYTFKIPNNLLIDTTNIVLDDGTSLNGTVLGVGSMLVNIRGVVTVYARSATELLFSITNPMESGYWGASFAPLTNALRFSFTAEIPIASWSVSTVFAGVNDPIYLSNSESVINTNGVVAKTKQGLDGTPILANTVTTYYDMTLPRSILPNETFVLQLRSKIDGNWLDATSAGIDSLYLAPIGAQIYGENNVHPVGAFVVKTTANQLRVRFCGIAGIVSANGWSTGVSSQKTWTQILAAADSFNAWRVRIGQSALSELAPRLYVFCKGSIGVSANTNIVFNEVIDTHNCYVNGVFTAPMTGKYRVSSNAFMGGVNSGYFIMKNASRYEQFTTVYANTVMGGSVTIPLQKNDIIAFQSDGATLTHEFTYLSIEYEGLY